MAKKEKSSIEYVDAIAEMEAQLSPERVERARKNAETEVLQLRLAAMRKDLGVRQEDIKGFSQASISKIEKRKDIKLSTLIEYMESLGMGLEIRAYPHKIHKEKDSYTLLKI
jgi:hypothetical protein